MNFNVIAVEVKNKVLYWANIKKNTNSESNSKLVAQFATRTSTDA